MLDFQEDIAPLRRQFAPMLVGRSSFDQAVAQYQTRVAPAQAGVTKAVTNLLQLQREDMAFRSQQMQFEREREQLRIEREANRMLPSISKRVDDLMNTDASPSEKRDALGALAAENAGAMARSEQLKTLFKLQDDRLRNQQLEAAKEEQKSQSWKNSALNIYVQSTAGTPFYDDTIREQIESGDISFAEASEMVGRANTWKSSRSAAAAAAETAAERAYEGQEYALRDIMKRIESPKMVEDAGYGYAEDGEAKPEFTDSYRRQLVIDMVRLRGGDPTDEAQRRAVWREYQNNDGKLYSDVAAMAQVGRTNLSSGRPLTSGAAAATNRNAILSAAGLSPQ